FIGAASGVAVSVGADTESECFLFLNSISTPVPVTSRRVSRVPPYSVKRYRCLSTRRPVMNPVKFPVSQGIRATEDLKEIPGSPKWFDCIQMYAEGKEWPQSFSM